MAQTLFHPSGSSFGNYGLWVDITGDWLFVGDVQEELVHIYQPSGGSWVHFQTLDGKADFGAIDGDYFGSKIDCSGNTVAVGEWGRNLAQAEQFTSLSLMAPPGRNSINSTIPIREVIIWGMTSHSMVICS